MEVGEKRDAHLSQKKQNRFEDLNTRKVAENMLLPPQTMKAVKHINNIL